MLEKKSSDSGINNDYSYFTRINLLLLNHICLLIFLINYSGHYKGTGLWIDSSCSFNCAVLAFYLAHSPQCIHENLLAWGPFNTKQEKFQIYKSFIMKTINFADIFDIWLLNKARQRSNLHLIWTKLSHFNNCVLIC